MKTIMHNICLRDDLQNNWQPQLQMFSAEANQQGTEQVTEEFFTRDLGGCLECGEAGKPTHEILTFPSCNPLKDAYL